MFGFLWWFSIIICVKTYWPNISVVSGRSSTRMWSWLWRKSAEEWRIWPRWTIKLGICWVTWCCWEAPGLAITTAITLDFTACFHPKLLWFLRYLYPKGRGTDWGLQPQSGEISETFGRRFFQPKHWQQWQVVVHGLDLGALVEDHKGGARILCLWDFCWHCWVLVLLTSYFW